MAAVGSVLSLLIQAKVDAKFQEIPGAVSPLAQTNPNFFIDMCNAIAVGIADTTTVINFVTSDTGLSALPLVPGVGASVGLVVDDVFFTEKMYKEVRVQSVLAFGSTGHPVFPPDPNTSFLEKLCEGIGEAIKEHFATVYTLTSSHAIIYLGTGNANEGDFSGLVAATTETAIFGAATILVGTFWPKLAKAIGIAYVDTILNHTISNSITITAVCVPSVSQTCELPDPGVGTGTGTAT